MSAKYSQPFTLPEDFPPQLRVFAREILRSNPTDINTFAYDYFISLMEERDIEKELGETAEKKTAKK